MAQIVVDHFGENKIDIVYDIVEDIEKLGYNSTLYMDLDVKKIEKLGWRPNYSLKGMFERMIKYILSNE